ncbi:MAG: recombinase XerD, partial [Planctomycetia bacterium]|nr:recombinase XerD [Planctomycetia bacterium]
MATTLPIESRAKVMEMLQYLRGKNPRDALLFQMGINTILRIGDILRLTVRYVMDESGDIRKYIDIREQKTSKYNRIIITST